jgi:membrane protein
MATPHPKRMPVWSWRAWFELLREAAREWQQDNCLRIGAALAFYTLLSLAPLLLVTIAIVALVLGDDFARSEVMARVEGMVGADTAATLRDMVERASQPRSGLLATAVGLAMSAIGASGVFGQLQRALNDIWDVRRAPGRGVRGLLLDRVRAFSMLLLIGVLLIASLGVGAALSALADQIAGLFPGAFLTARLLDVLTSIGVTAVLFGLTFKVLPDLAIRWSDVAVGALVSALLFAVGRLGISWYLGRASAASVYGAAGSLVVLLLWIYYSSQLLFFGAEFTQVYARRYGSLQPDPAAGSLPSAPAPR